MVRARYLFALDRDKATLKKKKEWLKEVIRKIRYFAWNHDGKCANGWENLKKLAYRVNNKHRCNIRTEDRRKKVMDDSYVDKYDQPQQTIDPVFLE